MHPFSNKDIALSLRKKIQNAVLFFLFNIVVICSFRKFWASSLFALGENPLFLFLTEDYCRLFALIYAILIAPIYEEIIFRQYLTFKVKDIAISLSAFILFIGINNNIIRLTIYDWELYFRILLSIIVFLGIIHISGRIGRIETFVNSSHYYPIIVVVSSCLFAICHLHNYTPLKEGYLLTYLFALLPRLNLGMACAYLRLNVGCWANISLHIINNAISFLIV